MQPDSHQAGNVSLSTGDIGVEITPMCGKPETVVYKLRILLSESIFKALLIFAETQVFKRSVSLVQDDGCGCFI